MSTTDGDPTAPILSSADVSRDILINFIRRSHLGYGEWARFKKLYKQMEADPDADMEMLAALIARLDGAPLQTTSSAPVHHGARRGQQPSADRHSWEYSRRRPARHAALGARRRLHPERGRAAAAGASGEV